LTSENKWILRRTGMSKITKICLTTLLLSTPICSFAAAYQLLEQSVADLGNSFAGGAALAEDASTGFFNAAGYTRLPNEQFVLSLTPIKVNIKFAGDTFAPSAVSPLGNYVGSGVANSRAFALVPALHYALRLSDRWFVGFGITSPYGLSDNYRNDSIVQFVIRQTQLQTTNLSPSVAYKLNDQVSLALGVDAMLAKERFNFSVRTASPVTADSFLKYELTSTGFGWHAGVLYEATPQLRLGASYRSQIVQQYGGSSTFDSFTGASTNTYVTARLTFPPLTMFSAHYDINPCWSVLGTADFTQWSVQQYRHFVNLASIPGTEITPALRYHNTWRFALAGNYKPDPQWMIRFGTSLDQTPTQTAFRDVRIPDSRYLALSVGAHYQAWKDLSLDVAFAKPFFKRARIDDFKPETGTLTVGNSDINAYLFGLQANWTLA